MRARLFAPVPLFALAACLGSSGPDPVPCDPLLLQQSALTGDTTTAENGLRTIEARVGSGTAVGEGHAVRVHYSGYLQDGTRFDTSCTSEIPFSLVLGPGRTIEGFWQGIVGMRVGGVRRVIIPPPLGYGSTARPGIPANSTLIFDLELLSILNE